MRYATCIAIAALTAAYCAPLAARDSLGVFSDWGAFRDPGTPRCYAIAMPDETSGRRQYRAFATVSHWPQRRISGQLHFRVSRDLAADRAITLTVGNRRFSMTGGGGDVWAQDRRMDAAIVAAMRSARGMAITASARDGGNIRDYYRLAGAATAMDAAAVGCAGRN